MKDEEKIARTVYGFITISFLVALVVLFGLLIIAVRTLGFDNVFLLLAVTLGFYLITRFGGKDE